MIVGVQSALAVGPIQDLGIPVPDYSILDVALGADASGNPRLYGSTYSVSANPGVTFFGVDPSTGTMTTQKLMSGSYGGYHTTVAPDGKVYLGTLTAAQTGQLWKYDPATDAVSIAAYQQEPAYSYFFGTAAASWGSVFVGGYPSGHLDELVPPGNLVDDGLVAAGSQFPKAIVPLSASPHAVFVGGGTPAAATVVNLDTGVRTNVLPSAYAGYEFAYNAALVDGYLLVQMVASDGTSKILRFSVSGASVSFVDELPGLSNSWGVPVNSTQFYGQGSCGGATGGLVLYDLSTKSCTVETSGDWMNGRFYSVTIGGSQWIASVGVHGLFGRWNPSTGQVVTNQLSLPGFGTNLTALATGPDGNIYGGTYETGKLFRYNVTSGATTVLGRPSASAGEILSMTSSNGKLFIGTYPNADMSVYDPTSGWSPGTSSGSNPQDIGALGTAQGRPWDMTTAPDGTVYTVTGATYGQLSGALTAVNNSSPYAQSSYRGVDGTHNLFSVAAGGGKVFLGSTKHGDGVNATGYEQILVWDIASHTAQLSAAIDFTSDYIESLVYAPNGLVWGSTDSGKLFSFSVNPPGITNLITSPYGPILGMINGPGGLIYGHSASTIFSLNPATGALTTLATTGTSYYRTLAFDSSGYLYWAAGDHLMRMHV